MLSPLLTLAQDDVPEATPGLTEACGEDPSFVCEQILERTDNETLAQIADWAVAKPLAIVFVFIVAWLVNRFVRRAIRRFVEHSKDEDFQRQMARLRRRTGMALLDTGPIQSLRRVQRAEAIGAVLRSIATFVIYTLAAFIALGELGVELGPLIAGAGIVGIALGFGAQNLVKDFLSGIFMLVEDQYGVGDIIDVGDAIGVVEGVSLRSTRIRGLDGTLWHVPNGNITRIGNMSQEWARALIDVEVAYGSDLNQAKQVIKRVADSMWQEDEVWGPVIMEEPEIWGVETLGASGVAVRLVLKVKPGEQWMLSREIRGRIKLALDEAGVEIPFPQRTVWHRYEDEAETPGEPTAPLPPEPEETKPASRPQEFPEPEFEEGVDAPDEPRS